MSTKNKFIRFGFFSFYMIMERDDIKKRLAQILRSKDNNNTKEAAMLKQLLADTATPASFVWKLLNLIKDGKVKTHHTIQEKIIEIDRSTFIIPDEEESFFFQMVHDRDDALSKKRLDQDRVSIPLENDEYISEFASILYSKAENCAMIQSNRYSVSPNQIAVFLTECLKDWYQKSFDTKESVPLKLELRPIYDRNLLDAVTHNKGIRKLEIKGTLPAFRNLERKGLNLPILNVRNDLAPMRGYTFSFTISANTQRNRGTAEYDFIDSEECNKLYDAYSQTEHDEDRISVKMFYQSMNDATEELVWAAPIKSATLTYRIDSRREITYLEMYEKMHTYYIANREDIKLIQP